MKKLRILDLFSGIGGFSLGLERTGGFETSAFCEIDPYCQKVLKRHWPKVPIYGDIKKLKGTDIGTVDIITGGYPCQPFSVAGKQKGVEDPRHLWPEYFRLVKELRPTWVIGENVGGHIKLGLDSVIEDLEGEGYSARTFSVSASSIGANHQRERIWILAHTNSNGSFAEQVGESLKKTIHETQTRKNGTLNLEGSSTLSETNTDVANTESDKEDGVLRTASSEHGKGNARMEFDGSRNGQPKREAPQDMANSNSEGSQRPGLETNMERKSSKISAEGSEQDGIFSHSERLRQQRQGEPVKSLDPAKEKTWQTTKFINGGVQGEWSVEPNVGRVAHGIPHRVDRLKALGNSLVPQIPFYIGQTILRTYEDNDTL